MAGTAAATEADVLAWLDARLERAAAARAPHITLTFAQSLDGCLSRPDGARTLLSGPDALHLTHALRARHAAILVGIGTVISDNPLLTTRLVDGTAGGADWRGKARGGVLPGCFQKLVPSAHGPRCPRACPPSPRTLPSSRVAGPSPHPVVLDPHVRMPPESRLLAREDGARPLLVVLPADYVGVGGEGERAERAVRRRAMEERGARCVEVPAVDDRMAWCDIISALTRALDVQTVMVEGGVRVMNGLLEESARDASLHSSHISALLTVAPTWLGGDKRVTPAGVTLESARWWSLGKDAIVAAAIAPPAA